MIWKVQDIFSEIMFYYRLSSHLEKHGRFCGEIVGIALSEKDRRNAVGTSKEDMADYFS